MEGLIESSLSTLEELKLELPAAAFEHSFGLVIMEAVQVGFIFSGSVGTGILLHHDKTTHTWSPPIAVGLTGLGAGFLAGIEKKHMVIFLTQVQMMHAMASDFSFRLGAEYSVAVGPIGAEYDVTGHVGTKGSGVTSGYTHTKGWYMGLEMQGAALAPRPAVNQAFYQQAYEPKKVLFGKIDNIPACPALDRLHAKLAELASAPPPEPAYAETIAQPFLKNTEATNTLDKAE